MSQKRPEPSAVVPAAAAVADRPASLSPIVCIGASAGGLIMVQEPSTAHYDGMPASAIATGLADYILPPAEMAGTLQGCLRGPYLRGGRGPMLLSFPFCLATRGDCRSPAKLATGVGYRRPRPTFPSAGAGAARNLAALGRGPVEAVPLLADAEMTRILERLREQTGHDFTGYKRSTMARRIERRLSVHHLAEPAAYLALLQANPHEARLLMQELLIRVTSFCRDPEAFEALAAKALTGLLESRPAALPLRLRVPGCATGEEVSGP